MSKKDLTQVRQVFRKAVEACPLPARELERALGIGSGNLYRLMDGSLDLRLRHLVAFAELLEVPPSDFLELGCPDAQAKARRRLTDWLEPGFSPSSPPAAAVSRQELAGMIREIMEDVLGQRKAGKTPARRSRR